MAEQHARPDVDIEEDVNDIIVTYPPLAADRHHIHVTAQSGVVILDGHVRTPISRRVLIERTADIPGVAGINADEFYDDETIRLQVGKILPYGVYANPAFGVVALTGALPAEPSLDEIIQRVARVPGVVRVVAALGVAHGA
jgi:osmotically-inducible protein OsmY